jgi:hypothetical protein
MPNARTQLEKAASGLTTKEIFYGTAVLYNGTQNVQPFSALFTLTDPASMSKFIVQGAFFFCGVSFLLMPFLRLLERPWMAMVAPNIALVDNAFSRSHIYDTVVHVALAVMEKQAVSCHDRFLLRNVCH